MEKMQWKNWKLYRQKRLVMVSPDRRTGAVLYLEDGHTSSLPRYRFQNFHPTKVAYFIMFPVFKVYVSSCGCVCPLDRGQRPSSYHKPGDGGCNIDMEKQLNPSKTQTTWTQFGINFGESGKINGPNLLLQYNAYTFPIFFFVVPSPIMDKSFLLPGSFI